MENTTSRAVGAIQELLDEMDAIILSGNYPATLPQVRTGIIRVASALSTEFSQRLQNVNILAATTASPKTTHQKVMFPAGNPPKRGTSSNLAKKPIAVVVEDKRQPQIQAIQATPPQVSRRKVESLYDISQQFVPIAKFIIQNSASDSGKTYGSNLAPIAANLGVDITAQKTDTAKAAAIKTFLTSFPNAEKWAANEEVDDSDDSKNENADDLEQVEQTQPTEIPAIDEMDTEDLLTVAGKDITTGAPTDEVASEAIQAAKKTKKK